MCKGCFFRGPADAQNDPRGPVRPPAGSVDFSFGKTKPVLWCFLNSSGLPDPGRDGAAFLSGTRRTGIWKSRFVVWRSDVENCLEAFRSPGSRRERLTAERSRLEMAPQRLENIKSAPGNGMGSEASDPQHLVHGGAADRARLRLTSGGNDWVVGLAKRVRDILVMLSSARRDALPEGGRKFSCLQPLEKAQNEKIFSATEDRLGATKRGG